MALLLLALAAGMAVGYVRRGRLANLATVRPVRSRLILTALGLYVLGVLGGWLAEPLLPILTGACWLTLSYYVWLNRRYPGAALLGLGLASNALAIVVNGGMPVSESAAARAGATMPGVLVDQGIAADAAVAPWLGKIIPIAFPPHPEVASIGDIAVAAACVVLIAGAMTRAPASPSAATGHPAPGTGQRAPSIQRGDLVLPEQP